MKTMVSDYPSKKIAVVGMAVWYPGAQSLRQFWENILAKRQQFREMVDCRLPLGDYYHPDKETPDKTYGRNAAYIENFEFDWQSRHIPKSSVDSSDIVHWLTLEVALKALRDAGYSKAQVKGSNTAVILGNTLTGEWTRANSMRMRWPFVEKVLNTTAHNLQMDDGQLNAFLAIAESAFKSVFPAVDEDTLAGALSNTVAGRVCNYLDLHGGGYTVDGACSSSLLAVIQGARSLVLNEVDMVFSGGVDISLDTFELIGFAKTGALTADEMRVYDQRASGFIPGEGCGFVVLKRLEDAVAANDRIYAVINGWGISSDGKGGITAPSVKGQAKALRTAYQMAGYDASQVDFVEGHGTGTRVGDEVELTAIQTAMQEVEPQERSVGVTSLKSILGHTKAAAGIGAFIKAVAAVNRRILPPISGTEVPRDVFQHKAQALYPLFDGETRPVDDVLRAGVSAMGFGGINSHVTCESFGPPAQTLKPFLDEKKVLAHPEDSEVFVFSSQSLDELKKQLVSLTDAVAHIAKAELADLAAHLAERLIPETPIRAALVADTPSSLKDRLEALNALIAKGVREGTFVHDSQKGIWLGNGVYKRRLGFMFPGQGSQRINMTKPLIRRFNWAAQWVADCEDYAETLGVPGLSHCFLVDNAPMLAESTLSGLQRNLAQTEVAQPAICLSSLIWYRYLINAGIEPVAVGGHSLGELMALYAGDVYDEQTLFQLASRRGYEMGSFHGDQPGKMAALLCDQQQAETLLREVSGYVTLANINSPEQVAVSGDAEAVEALIHRAGVAGITAKPLPVSNAFHSRLMTGAAERFGAAFADLKGQVSARKVLSCMDGRSMSGEVAVGEHLQRQMLAQVDFVALAKALAAQADLIIEVGSGRVLTDLFSRIVPPEQTLALPVEPKASSTQGLKQVLAAVHVFGHELNWRAIYADRLIRPYIPSQQRRFIENPCEREITIDTQRLAPLPLQTPSIATVAAQTVLATADDPIPTSSTEPVNRDLPSAPANTTPSSTDNDALAQVLKVAAQLTGYDVGSLSEDMRLLDDLNMDSIKAAELLAILGRAFQVSDALDIADYANATLGEIADFLKTQAGNGPLEQPSLSTTTPVPETLPDNAASISPVVKTVVQRVAALTGYDAATLTGDMRLLDDLNMDSIKVAELLGLLVREFHKENTAEVADYANATLDELCTWLAEPKVKAPTAATATTVASPPSQKPALPVTFRETWVRNFVETARHEDLLGMPDESLWRDQHVWLIRQDDDEFSRAWSDYFRKAGAQLTETYFAAWQEAFPEAVSHVLVVVPYAEHTVTVDELGQFVSYLQTITLAALGVNGTDAKPTINYVQPYTRYPERQLENSSFSVNAYASSLALEQPNVVCRVINVSCKALPKGAPLAKAIGSEMLAQPSQVIVALDEQLQRWVPDYQVQEPALYQDQDLQWSNDDVVLVTGGARGITAECALGLAQISGAKMALIGSSPLSKSHQDDPKGKEIRAVLDRYKAMGLTGQYYSGDISDAVAVADLVKQITQELGPISGVIHGAGLNRPRPVTAVSPSAAVQECVPKVCGITHLLDRLEPQRLKLVAGFSSIIGVTGMPGNAWYGFANETLANLLAAYGQANPQTHVVSIAYSVWDEVGMGARLGSVDNLRKQGIGAIPVDEGVLRFLRLVSAKTGVDQVVVAGRMGPHRTWNKADTLSVNSTDSNQAYREQPLYYQPGVELVVRRQLSLTKDLYLLDHNFKGSYLFPTVFGLEAMAQAVRQVTGVDCLDSLSIRDISLERPISVSEHHDTEIEIYAEVAERETDAEPLQVRAGVRCDLSGFKRDHFAATFVLGDLGIGPVHEVEAPEEPLGIKKQGALYGDILFQGPRFQRINTLHRLENPAPGKGICVFQADYENSEFLLNDPYFRDALLQSVQIIIPQDLSLPVSIERIDIYQGAKDQNQERQCVAYLNRREGDYYLATVVTLSAADGRVLERLDGYRLKILENRERTEINHQVAAA